MRSSRVARAVFAVTALLAAINPLQAKEAETADMLVYISPDEYKHSNRLSHYNFREFWYEQGPVVEPYVAQVLDAELEGNVGLCEAGKTANTLVWLKPDMDYNSTLRTFNGKITAEVFLRNGKPLATFVGQSRRDGHVDVVPAYQVDAAYKAAMQDLAYKMKSDEALQSALKQHAASGEDSTTCAMLPLLPVARSSNPLQKIFE